MTHHRHALRIRVRGLVQGVGFRPFVYHLANRLGLTGDVLNDGAGVLIRVQGDHQSIERFVAALRQEAPALSQITAIEESALESPLTRSGFCILDSSSSGRGTAGVVPDAMLCDDCLAEIDDPAQRRYRYGFASCTQCGPRFSIVEAVPYDRANTTMRGFPMCASCRAEYEDQADRRFHAQPIACPDCGPRLRVCDPAGQAISVEDPLVAAVSVLRAGGIVGLKSLGGYHLACDATNDGAVSTLRHRKRRPSKPFALMALDIATIARYALPGPVEVSLLQSPAAPIVLLRQAGLPTLASSLAPRQVTLGWMLPTTPLHHLLLREFGGPLVMTSGNRSDEPQAIDDLDAVQRLGTFVDLFLMHDRPIARRLDDSVARVARGEVRLLRRARGYAPAPLPLPPGFSDAAPVLALGGDLKAAVCLTRDGEALLSHHLGDLADSLTHQEFEKAVDACALLFAHAPALLACDMHPGYHSTVWAQKAASRLGLPLLPVQHHHAHIAAVMTERLWPREAGPVVGIALDGLGFGADGTVWGGEILLCRYGEFQRLAHLRPVPMPGGKLAVEQPWRNLVAHLDAAFGAREADAWLARLACGAAIAAKPLTILRQSVRHGLNAPLSSSCGRLFDAAAAALGVAPDQLTFEGEAAMALEALADAAGPQQPYPFALTVTAPHQIDAAPMWAALLGDLARGVPPEIVAARFHAGIAEVFCRLAVDMARRCGTDSVALGGGCFQNEALGAGCEARLRGAGLTVLTPAMVPANDGGLALGQAAVAAAIALAAG
jgi:hydrogenase maturation protein HypF